MRTPAPNIQPRYAGRCRQYGVFFLLFSLLTLGACEFGTGEVPEWLANLEKPKKTEVDGGMRRLSVGSDDRFFGVAIADEPLATLVARNVLAAGGTAADAAVALYFSLSVTSPAAASLGGGGVCLIYDPDNQEVSVLDFLQSLPATDTAQVGLVPGNVGGMAALHQRFQGKAWGDLIAPAENYAKKGIRISRGLAKALDRESGHLISHTETRHLLANHEGRILREGDRLYQFDLASTLKHIRTLGPETFYRGTVSKKLVRASAERGGMLNHARLGAFRVAWRAPLAVKFGESSLYTTGSTGGRAFVRLWEMLIQDERYQAASAEERPHLLAEISMRAFAGANTKGDREGWMADYDPQRHVPVEQLPFVPTVFPDNPATTSYAVVDRKGLAVICSHTMYRPFGTGAVVPGVGVFFSGPMAPANDIALAPLLVMRDVGKARLPERGGKESGFLEMKRADPLDYAEGAVQPYINMDPIFLAGPSGGAASVTALAEVAAEVLLLGEPLVDAMAAPRIHHGGLPDIVLVEEKPGSEQIQGLLERDHRAKTVGQLGHVNAISCMKGVRLGPENCETATDLRGF